LRNGRFVITIAWYWIFTGALHFQVLSVDIENVIILAESTQVSGSLCEYVLPPKATRVGNFLRQHRDTGRPIALRWGDVISSIVGPKKKDVFFTPFLAAVMVVSTMEDKVVISARFTDL
jgi:hypothetical protein